MIVVIMKEYLKSEKTIKTFLLKESMNQQRRRWNLVIWLNSLKEISKSLIVINLYCINLPKLEQLFPESLSLYDFTLNCLKEKFGAYFGSTYTKEKFGQDLECRNEAVILWKYLCLDAMRDAEVFICSSLDWSLHFVCHFSSQLLTLLTNRNPRPTIKCKGNSLL